jgi:hypothetical protein
MISQQNIFAYSEETSRQVVVEKVLVNDIGGVLTHMAPYHGRDVTNRQETFSIVSSGAIYDGDGSRYAKTDLLLKKITQGRKFTVKYRAGREVETWVIYAVTACGSVPSGSIPQLPGDLKRLPGHYGANQ